MLIFKPGIPQDKQILQRNSSQVPRDTPTR